MAKPTFIFGADDSPELCIYSPDGTKSVVVSLTNDGVLTAAGIPIVLDCRSGYEEVTYSNNKASSVIIWTDNMKAQKIREQFFSYTGSNITQIVTNYYSVGEVAKTMTEVIVYDSQGKTASITRSIS